MNLLGGVPEEAAGVWAGVTVCHEEDEEEK